MTRHYKIRTSMILIAAALLFCLTATAVGMQDPPPKANDAPALLTRCATVSLKTTSGWLSPGVMEELLLKSDEFRAAQLSLVSPDAQPDIRVTVGDESDETHAFDQPRDATHDAHVQAIRVRDRRTATHVVSGLGGYEGIVVQAVIETLHQLCPAVMTPADWRRSNPEPVNTSLADELRQAHTLSVESNTYLDDEQFVRKLASRPEVAAWGLDVSAHRRDADMHLEIGRRRDSFVWHCELHDRSGRVLWSHDAGALREDHAVNGIIDGFIAQIARYRETPESARKPRESRSQVTRGRWHARLITGDFRTTLEPFEITVDGEFFVARNSLGRKIYEIRAADVEDVDHSTVRDPIWQMPPPVGLNAYLTEQDEEAWATRRPRDVIAAAAADGGYSVIAGVFTLVFFPFNPRQHFFEIAWTEGEVHRKAMFQLNGRDASRLLDAARSLMDARTATQRSPRP